MENIILLILFTYPGAFVEFTYHHFAKDMPFYHEPETYFRTARIFFISALMTLGCLTLFGAIYHGPLNLSNAVMFLSKDNYAIYFAIVSCAASIAVGLLWFGAAFLIEWGKNIWRSKHNKARSGKRGQVWMSMMVDKDLPKQDYVIEIRKNGELVRCGLAKHVPDDLRKDTGFVLTQCEVVKKYLDHPDYDVISGPLISYLDIKDNTEIIIRDGSRLCDWLTGKLKE